ncbi:hypothetical protein G6L08_22610 [Agrobacterium rhizogenes]|nr:hypothetical protein [Rhizobium rhizogenes]
MDVVGLKTTHDGAVALIKDDELIFSIEEEKISNNARYAKIGDFNDSIKIVEQYADPSRCKFVLDGWYKTHKTLFLSGHEVEVKLAPYRRGIWSDDILQPYNYSMLDLKYTSYSHYAGHVASAYCTSPFAKAGEDAYVLAWDSHMLPYLYHVSYRTGKIRSVGFLHYMMAETYCILANLFPPFDHPRQYPDVLGVGGRLMAYVATGTADEEYIVSLEKAYVFAQKTVCGDPNNLTDRDIHPGFCDRFAEAMVKALKEKKFKADDMLASIHEYMGEKLLVGLREIAKKDGFKTSNFCLSGGAALNIKWNSRIRGLDFVENLWVPPFPNDAGSAIGAACCELLKNTDVRYIKWSAYAGPELNNAEIRSAWEAVDCSIPDLALVIHAENEPVVVLNGRAELGPRALGHRSIIAACTDASMKDKINIAKRREWYRPVSPICLEEHAPSIFSPGTPDPYMLYDHFIRAEWLKKIPAVSHLDETARLQTVSAESCPHLHSLLTAYYELSGVPVLCNTSANMNSCGFFPDVQSAMDWGRLDRIWSDGKLYRKRAE